MRVGLLAAAAGWLLGASCGIETVAVLPTPDVDYSTQSGTNTVTLTHSASRYAGTDFQGYEVYYRIYPTNSTGVFTQLSSDISTLSSGPLSTLTASLGYQTFTQAGPAVTDGQNITETLDVTGLADGDVVTLDFSDFLAAGNQSSLLHQPVLKINGTTTKTVYRNVALATGAKDLQKFATLRTSLSSAQADMKALSTASPTSYEIDIFIVAYGMTSTVQSLNSVPKAWGTIHDVTP